MSGYHSARPSPSRPAQWCRCSLKRVLITFALLMLYRSIFHSSQPTAGPWRLASPGFSGRHDMELLAADHALSEAETAFVARRWPDEPTFTVTHKTFFTRQK